ncbi:MAG TPA: folylpolyglutamate synthase/dihydrofolate synthase family protein [Euzebyales bacterium]|nr:folylpolyglutamate synthase/dihydrofolate synthase family protein [Euzebyales bacterium]
MTILHTTTAYEQAITELFNRRPEVMVPGLRRIQALVHSMGEPQRAYAGIHLTGTNGKTSTARMITSLLLAAGERVGTYTSPHLQDVRERFRIDGEPLAVDDLLAGLDALGPHIERVEQATGEMVTFFEASTALCLWAFARARVDTGVVEVGMGGRFDATNVVDAHVAVLGRVQMDHPQLGATVGEIAWEKAGITADGATVISANTAGPPAHVIAEEVAERGARLHVLDRDFGVIARTLTPHGQRVSLRGLGGSVFTVDLPVHGAHQADNAACALAAVQAHTGQPLESAVVRAGFAGVRSPGRLELLFTDDGIPVLLDGAHNPAAARMLARSLRELHGDRRRIAVLGVMADKDIPAIVDQLRPVVDEVVVTMPDSPRAATAEQLAAVCHAGGLPVAAGVPDVGEAVRVAAWRAGSQGMVVVSGSLYTVGDARAALGGVPA